MEFVRSALSPKWPTVRRLGHKPLTGNYGLGRWCDVWAKHGRWLQISDDVACTGLKGEVQVLVLCLSKSGGAWVMSPNFEPSSPFFALTFPFPFPIFCGRNTSESESEFSQPQESSEEGNVDSRQRLQLQLEEDGDGRTEQSWMGGKWSMAYNTLAVTRRR